MTSYLILQGKSAKPRLQRSLDKTKVEPGAITGFRQISRSMIAMLAAVLTFTSLSSNVLAQAAAGKTNPAKSGSAQVTLNLQDVDIRVLINTVAEVSGKNFVVDPRVKGKVSVISGASLDPAELYDVFLSILEVHNFATVDSGSVIKILPSNLIKQRPTPFGPTLKPNDTQITQIIQLKYAPVQDLVPIIRPLIPPSSHFAPHVPSNSVVLTDTAANIQRVMKIIKRIDVPDKRSSVRVVYLDKTRASDLATTLTQIMASSADPKAAGIANDISIQPLDSINALVISANDDDYAKVKALIDELDIERELVADINVIYLKHAKAEDLVSVLNDVTKTETPGAIETPVVQADEATNSIIIKATGGQLKTMREVIDKLDIRRAQVFVETVIAEVSLTQAANLGVTWGAGGPNTITNIDGTTSEVGNLINKDRPNQIIGTAALESTFELATGGLTYSLLDYGKYNLNVIVNALRADSNSNILSTPTILTLDNEEAEIVVGQEVPFVTGSYNNGNNNSSTTGPDGGTVITSGSSFQTIERKDVGIKLKIKPQISDGDTIQLEVLQEISSVAETAIDGQADLITNRRSIEATVQVDDGQVVVLGGLIQDDVIDTVSWVPILGKIPVLGALFRSKSKTAIKRNLMVFLKPRIIRSADELASYSKVKYDEVRRDSEISRENSSKYLIDDADPPVMDEYENVIGDGKLSTERRKILNDNAENDDSGLKGLMALFGKKRRDREASREDSGELKTEDEMPDHDPDRIEWDAPADAPAATENKESAVSPEEQGALEAEGSLNAEGSSGAEGSGAEPDASQPEGMN